MINLKEIDRVILAGPFAPTWDSLSKQVCPDWYRDAKFGIFIHWGVYSVPAFGSEWYSRNMYIQGNPCYEYHREQFGDQASFGYQDLIPLFRAEQFDPASWLNLFEDSGARYLFPVAEHHDGFQMYASSLSPYNSLEMGPKRDVLGQLKAEADKRGLRFCTSSHRAEHQFFFSHGKEFESDIPQFVPRNSLYWPAELEPKDHFDLTSEPYPSAEFLEDWLLRTCELVRDYQPELLYFDWWIQHESFRPYLMRFLAYYYNLAFQEGRSVAVCYKQDALPFGSGIVEMERGGYSGVQSFPWQMDTAIARNSWCYTRDLVYKTSKELLQNLIDVVAKNGNLLLNIGPKADGTIPKRDQQILREMGDWLAVNGEAIYGSRPWRVATEGSSQQAWGAFSDGEAPSYTSQDIRYTFRDGFLYALQLDPSREEETVLLTSLAYNLTEPQILHARIQRVELLGNSQELDWQQDASGLQVKLPGTLQNQPRVLRISF